MSISGGETCAAANAGVFRGVQSWPSIGRGCRGQNRYCRAALGLVDKPGPRTMRISEEGALGDDEM